MNIKIDAADKVFSQYIRLRDMHCVRCGSPVELNGSGLPISHQCSHFYSRSHYTVREDEENCICLCYPCHRIWGGDGRRDYENYMIKWLGQKRFDLLTLRANSVGKKDRKLSLIIATALLNSIYKKK